MVVLIAAVAFLHAAGWAMLTPPFQVPDETAHFAYVQSLAETGKRPGVAGAPEFSSEQRSVMEALRTTVIIGRAIERGPGTPAADRGADAAISNATDSAARDDAGGPSTASGQPALYYLLAVVPYKLTSWASVPTRIVAIRLLGAFFLALTAALVALLAVEFAPRLRWAPLVAGSAVALQPVVGFISAGVTPDALLMAISTALLLTVVRGFRRGVTPSRLALLGLLLGAGVVTKLTFLALLPPAGLALALLLWRSRTAHGGLAGLVRVVAFALALPAAFLLWTKLQGMPIRPPGTVTTVLPSAEQNVGTGREQLSYIWQLYLPRIPGQYDQFGFSPPTETWIKGLVGRYGWLDYASPLWMVDLARWLLRLALVLGLAALVRYRKQVRERAVEIVVLLGFVASLLVVIGHEGYGYRNSTGLLFEQARYVFPVIAIYGLAVVAACGALGRRLAPAAAVGCVALFAAHLASGVLLTVDRYYGG